MRPSGLLTLAFVACAGAGSASLAIAQPGPPPTFTRDLAPIVFEHCVSCHRPGGSAPFALVTYEDLRARARQVVAAVSTRTMPPWMPEGAPGEFEGDRRLTDQQVQTFSRWLEAGAPQGPPADLPPLPAPPGEWELGPPDLVLRLERPFELPAQGPDRLRNFVVPIPVGATRYVRAWEFRTSTTRVVHHATLMVDRGGGARRLDEQTVESGYEGLIPFSAQSPDGYFLGWTPGQRAQRSSPDMAWRVDPGNDLIVMLHMRPGGAIEPVDASIALYFSERQPSSVPVMIRLNRQDLDIPAGASAFEAVDRYTLPVDVDLYAIQPHAHYLARSARITAGLPGGATTTLLHVPAWDFHWQDVYRYVSPVLLPAGTQLTMEFRFDNSSANRDNPNSPPARVIWGQRSSDEMADAWLQVVPRRREDRERLVTDLRRKLVPQDIDGYRKMLEVQPGNAALHDDLALLAIEAGDLTLAIQQFERVVGLRPAAAAAHYNLGNALMGAGRAPDAERRFREALRLDPAYGLAWQGLGLALAARGLLDGSAAALTEAGRLMPASADAVYNLGVVRQRQGREAEALRAYDRAANLDGRHAEARYGAALLHGGRGEHLTAIRLLREALAVRPAWTDAHVELAWLLAVSAEDALRSPLEALALADAAVRAAGAAASVRLLDVHAAALAANGAYAAAAAQVRGALALPAAAEPGLRAALQDHLSRFERHEPLRLP
ncbi:MAG: tetratricopeptide repeat protein [Vicinamibacterales bacterium]